MANERTAFNRRKAEKKPITLDTFRLQSRRTPLVSTKLLLDKRTYSVYVSPVVSSEAPYQQYRDVNSGNINNA